MQLPKASPDKSRNGISNNERFRMLYEISAINSSNPEVQLDSILLIATRLFGLDIGIISKIEGEIYTVLHYFHPDDALKKGQVFDLQHTYCEITLRSNDVEAISYMKKSQHASHPCYAAFGLESYIGIPLHVNGKRFGTLNFSSSSPVSNTFSEEDKRIMRIMGAWVGNILANQENLNALRKSEAEYKMLVENGLALLCIHDLSGKIIQVNKTALKELGYSAKEMIDKNLMEFMMPLHAVGFQEYLMRIKKHKKDSGILPILTKAGKLRYWSYNNTVENNRIIGFSQDVTEKVKVERALAERKHSLKEAQAMAKLGSWSLNPKSNRISCSDETFQIFGWNPELMEMSLDELKKMFHPDDAGIVSQIIEEAIQKKEVFSIEHRIILSNGLIKHVLSKGRPVINQKGDLTQLICMVQDITDSVMIQQELIEAKELAEEAARIKQEFLANMSHEIRTPMNAVMGFARLLLQAELTNPFNQYVQTIYDSADTLLVIINDILDFSKIEAGRMSITPIHFDLRKSISTLQKFFSVKVNEKSVKLIFEIDENLPPALIGDPVRITQILNNLVNNAIKFTEKGFVEVKVAIVSQENDEYLIQFSVKDSGIGIPKNKIKSIFNSFEQANGDITRKFGGTGLGLTIVKKLVELMNGQIQVESDLGKGSVFTLVLPFQEGNVDDIKIENLHDFEMLPLELLHGKQILLVEDNRNNQVLAKKFLSEVGCKVDIANNGLEAIYSITKNHYDIVLMDIQMPEMDGIQATKIIKKLEPPFNTIPILAMTAHALKEEEMQYKEVGMTDYISKPFMPGVLYSKLLHTLNLRQQSTIDYPKHPYHQISDLQPDEIDFNYLKQYAGGDQDFFNEMLQIFLEDVPGYLIEIEKSFNNQNWDDLKKTVHTLKSSIGFVEMENTLRKIKEIEDINQDEIDLEDIRASCIFIVENCEKVIELAKIELNSNQS